MTERFTFFAPSPRGTEQLLAEELRSLGARSVRPFRAGVSFAGRLAVGLRACLWSRVASRVLLQLAEVDAGSSADLYEAVKAIPWEDHLRADGTLSVDANGTNAELRDTRFIAVRVKDAIADRFREREGRRPSVDTAAPDVRVNVSLRGMRAVLSIDLAGEPLHRRGYREAGVQALAPLKENLAAAVVLLAGWRAIAERGGGFCDPLCGSGTLAIEAALVAGDVAPGLLRARWGFDRWLGADAEAWEALLAEADDRAEAGRAAMPPMAASDADARAVEVASACVRRAGLAGVLAVERRGLADAVPPEDAKSGLLLCNPPYGERMGDRESLATLYRELASAASGPFCGWELAVLSGDSALRPALGLSMSAEHALYNGAIPTTLTVFGLPVRETASAPAAAASASVDASDFANRLGKMARHHGKWARRAGVTCYRVYDADLPDFALAIDVYEGAAEDTGRRFAHVAEYAAPPSISPALAEARLAAALEVVPDVLAVEPADVFVKRRERQRGSAQYGRFGTDSAVHAVAEGGLTFEVNLSAYLDTGLFLDQRITRERIRELASGKRFLNLFAYTGTATAYAAAGGAATTATVDTSSTYLAWAERNLARNGLAGEAHRFVRADALSWPVEAARRDERYDLIFCDPPTFSAGKRMEGTLDIQRDHVRLIADVAQLLADDDALLLFSCNRRGFRMDTGALAAAGLRADDVSLATIPPDFARNPKVHVVWEVRRA